MVEKDGKFSRAVELPICPFCDGKVYYTSWTTHKIYQMECESCKAHWRAGITGGHERKMIVELTSSKNPEISGEYLNKKVSIQYWKDMLRRRIGREF